MASLHDLQWVVAHNAYLQWNPDPGAFGADTLYRLGYRGFELDIWRRKSAAAPWQWSVSHTNGYRATDPTLGDYLVSLHADWVPSRGRDPVFLHLDIKDGDVPEGFAAGLDGYLRHHLEEIRIFTPRDLLGPDGRWQEWPDPASPALRDAIIVVLSGSDGPRTQYAGAGRGGVLGFPDFDPFRGPPRLIANTQYQGGFAGGGLGSWRCDQPSMLWRVYSEGAAAGAWRDEWARSGANMLALDFDGTDVRMHGQAFWANPLCG